MPDAAVSAGTRAMAMLVLRKGEGEPDVIGADLLSFQRQYAIAVAGDAALDHFEADDLALRAAGRLHFKKRFASEKSPLSNLSQRSRPASRTLMSSEISWP